MTHRRAIGHGKRTRQVVACLRTLRKACESTAALVVGMLLCSGTAQGMHPTHARHAAPLSAGKTPAHTVHDTGIRTAHSAEKSSRHARQHGEHPSRDQHAKARLPRGAASSRHADSKPLAKAHGRRRHHEEQPVDDPMPVRRAHNKRGKEPAQEQLAARQPVREHRLPAPPPSREAALHAAPNGLPGNVARNLARRQGNGRSAPSSAELPLSAAPETGIAHPDDDERLSMGQTNKAQAPFARNRQGSAPIVLGRPSPAFAANANVSRPNETPASTEVVEGFGAEVDFHTAAPVSRADRAPVVIMPHETPAQEERDLREAAEIASKPMFVPLYGRDGKLIVPPPLKGSRDILIHQNQMADDAGLSRIQDDYDLDRMRRAHLLVDFPESASLRMNEGLPENRRSARPWTVRFATDIAHAFYARFGDALQVNSAVRTVAYQVRLQRVNGNAAATEGEAASPHLTGQALDFGKRGMSMAEIAWMRSYLMPLIEAGKIDVEEEFQQACFHISVYASYAPAPKKHLPAKTEVAENTRTLHPHTTVAEGDLR